MVKITMLIVSLLIIQQGESYGFEPKEIKDYQTSHQSLNPAPEDSLFRAYDLFERGKIDEAVEILDRLEQTYRDDEDLIALMAAILGLCRDDLKAVDYYQRLIAMHPDEVDYREALVEYYLMRAYFGPGSYLVGDIGGSLMRRYSPTDEDKENEFKAAMMKNIIDECHRIMEIKSDYYYPYEKAGIAFLFLGDSTATVEYLMKASQCLDFPDDSRFLLVSLLQDLGRIDEACDQCEILGSNQPKNWQYMGTLAELISLHHDGDEHRILELRRAARVYSNFPPFCTISYSDSLPPLVEALARYPDRRFGGDNIDSIVEFMKYCSKIGLGLEDTTWKHSKAAVSEAEIEKSTKALDSLLTHITLTEPGMFDSMSATINDSLRLEATALKIRVLMTILVGEDEWAMNSAANILWEHMQHGGVMEERAENVLAEMAPGSYPLVLQLLVNARSVCTIKAASRILSIYGDPDAFDILVPIVLDPAQIMYPYEALYALAKTGNPQAVDVLIMVAADSDRWDSHRHHAMCALDLIPSELWIKQISDMRQDPVIGIHVSCYKHKYLEDESADGEIVLALMDESKQELTIKCLTKLKITKFTATIKSLLKPSEEEVIIEAILEYLKTNGTFEDAAFVRNFMNKLDPDKDELIRLSNDVIKALENRRALKFHE